MSTFLQGPFLWDVDGKAADNSCKDASTSHHLQNYFPALQLCQVVPWRVIEGGEKKKKEWCHLSNRALNLRVNVLERWALEDDDGCGDDDGTGHWSGHGGDDNDDVIFS